MRVLSIGTMNGISNTCKFRSDTLKRIIENVDVVNTSCDKMQLWYRVINCLFVHGMPIPLPECNGENERIIELIQQYQYDIIWVDKGITISKKTFNNIKRFQPKAKLVSFSLDNMLYRRNQSQNYLNTVKVYDYHITTKSYNINGLYKLGAKKVLFTNQSYEDTFHYPREVSNIDRDRLGADVGFIGRWEEQRMESILYITRHGIKVRVFGNEGWRRCKNDNPNLVIEDYGLFDEDYAKAFRCFKICLCFLSKPVGDLHTSRSIEIPACGGFMLAERTSEHLNLFDEGKEAEYFSSNEELLQKCVYYLQHQEKCERIAKAGRQRCLNSEYSNVEMIKKLISQII